MRVATIRKDIPVGVIRRTIKNTNDGVFRLRLMIVEKLLSEPDMSLQAIAESLIVNRETVTKCLNLFNQGGLEMLRPKRAGRKEGNPKYDSGIFSDLIRVLGESREEWSVYKMQDYIRDRHEVTVPESTIYYRIAKLGFAKRARRV
ncbi:MAG: helix-turn-helix domain-containing protein [Helicobacteraceae bacterium]|jgi:predicted transcriptional regulator|nr:helix-turn-helix domain-containing protein [Helicobacteraceae bacterium]